MGKLKQKKFKITFSDVFEAEDEIDAIDELRAYLRECVVMVDVTAFDFEEIEDGQVKTEDD